VSASGLPCEAAVRELPVADTRPLRREVLRPAETVEQQAQHEPAEARAVGAFVSGELVAVGLIGPEEPPGSWGGGGVWRVRGMATAPAQRGRGLGAAVLGELLRIAREAGAERVWCTARAPARSLYERAGFEARSDVYELPGIGPHVVMERRL
jgi:GNAT superfamily N-acetyltransferase